jgi:hypothetical protein
MMAHLRTEAYPVYGRHRYPPLLQGQEAPAPHSYERNVALIAEAKRKP